MTNPNDVLPREVAIDFGRELVPLITTRTPEQFPPDLLESLGRIAFKRSLEIAEQIDFGSEDVR